MRKSIFSNTGLVFLLIAILIFTLYAQTLSYDILYNYDDDAYILDNRIKELNSAHIQEHFSDYYLGMYQPLPVLSFSVLLHFFPESIYAQRLTNLLLHCLNVLLVLIFIKRLTGNQKVAAFSAILFAIHPMHVESVTWLATRSNLMYTAFFLTALILYLRWQDKRNVLNWMFMFVFFLLALFCKVTAATLPLLLPLLDWYKGRKFGKATLLLYLPLAIASLFFIKIGIHASGAFGHITELNQQYSLPERVIVLFHALWLYLYKAIFPLDLSAIYLYPWKQGDSLPFSFVANGIIAVAITTLLLIIGIINRKKDSGKAILFGLLFFLITISIVMPLKWSRTVLIAERYTYIPYIGLWAGILLLFFRYTEQTKKWIKISLLSLLVAGIVLFSLQSFIRNKAWRSPITLFTDVIEKNKPVAEVSMAYFNRGNEYLRLNHENLALSDYNTAIQLFPSFTDAYYNRALIAYHSGNLPAAVQDFSAAIKLKPGMMKAFLNRGTVYRAMGNYEAALDDFSHIIQVTPDGAAYFSRGTLYYFNLNEPDHACDDWNMALNLGFDPAKETIGKFCK